MNAVDSRGICQNCGWREPIVQDSSPSLGETRAAEIPSTQIGARGTGVGVPSPFDRTVDLPRYAQPPSTRVGTASGVLNTPGGNGRFCGTCGARIERGEVFCGQCGTPVGSSRTSYTGQGMTGSGPSRYVVGDDDDWSPGNGSELTEALMPSPPVPMPAQYNRGISGLAYNQAYGSSAGYGSAAASQSSRTTRVVWGVVCLVASLVVAGAAVLVAIH